VTNAFQPTMEPRRKSRPETILRDVGFGRAAPNVAKRMECVQLAAAFEACQPTETQGDSKAAASCTHSIRFATFGGAMPNTAD